MHAASPADRNFQRKLSSLNNLQAETVRLERAQRAANRGGSVPAHLVYKQEMVEAGRWQIADGSGLGERDTPRRY